MAARRTPSYDNIEHSVPFYGQNITPFNSPHALPPLLYPYILLPTAFPVWVVRSLPPTTTTSRYHRNHQCALPLTLPFFQVLYMVAVGYRGCYREYRLSYRRCLLSYRRCGLSHWRFQPYFKLGQRTQCKAPSGRESYPLILSLNAFNAAI